MHCITTESASLFSSLHAEPEWFDYYKINNNVTAKFSDVNQRHTGTADRSH